MAGTTVGNITGYLRLDKSDWDAQIAEAQAQADALGRADPNIRVTADVDEALEGIAAVDAAEQSMSDRNLVFAVDSEGTVEAVTATTELDVATQALTDSLLALSAAEDDADASTDATTASQKAQSSAFSGNIDQTKLMAGALGLVFAASGPLASALVGLGGAFAGMASAGILAVIGIKNAMDQGTQTGEQYSAGLQTLKGDLDGLANSAATGMLTSFQGAVQTINAAMPQLNQYIGAFAQELGQAGDTTLDGVIEGIKVANPLFQEAASLIQDAANGFDQWANDGGLQKFVTYAEAELPKVTSSISSLVSGAIQLGIALGPSGDEVIQLINSLGKVAQVGGQVLQFFNSMQDSVTSALKSMGGFGTFLQNFINTMGGFINPAQGVSQWIGNISSATSTNTSQTNTNTDSKNNNANASDNQVSANTRLQSEIDASTKKLQGETTQADLLNNAFDLMNNKNLGLAQAQTALSSSTLSLTNSFTANGLSLDQSTTAGVSNAQAIQNVITAAQQAASAVATSTGSTKQGAQAYSDEIGAIENNLAAHGDLTGGVQDYINTLANVPGFKSTLLQLDDDAAKKEAETYYSELNGQTFTWHMTIQYSAPIGPGLGDAGQPVGKAHGGTIFAATGMTVPSTSGSSFADNVPAMLSGNEEIVQAASASYPGARQLIKSINSNPRGTMQAIQGQQSGPVQVMVQIVPKPGVPDFSDYVTATATYVTDQRFRAETRAMKAGYRGR